MIKYSVVLNNKDYLDEFINYLNENNIEIEFKHEKSLIFFILADENQSKAIKELSYVKLIIKDEMLEIDFEKPEEVSTFELETSIDYMNWGVNRVLAPCMWRKNINGTGINVAVLDTGIGSRTPNSIPPSIGHFDLDISGEVSFIPGQTPEDFDGHGTHVAGIIAAKGRNPDIDSHGVAYNVNLFNVKVVPGSAQVLINGILWCGDNNIQVANMSLSWPPGDPDIITRQLVQNAIDYSRNQGCIFVSTTGNDGNNTVNFPASAIGVIAVGSIDIDNNRAFDSNTGPGIDYVAPGVLVESTYIPNIYARLSGTSMAAPQVTGLIALLLSEDSSRTQADIERILTDSALDLGDPGYDFEFGNGLVQAPRPPMTLTANSSKKVFDCEKYGFIEIVAIDSDKNPIEDIPINVTIQTPSGMAQIISDIMTDSLGKVTLDLFFKCCNCNPNPIGLLEFEEVGEYKVKVVANPSCSLPSTVYTSFEVLPFCLNSFVDTNKKDYLAIDNGVLIGLVTDSDGNVLADADVKFTITSPSGKKIIRKYKTNQFGLVYFNFNVDCPSGVPINKDPLMTEIGPYTVEMIASKTGYKDTVATTTFNVLQIKLKTKIIVDHEINKDTASNLIVEVKDELNNRISYANVKLVITSPFNEDKIYNLVTNKYGEVCINIATSYNCFYRCYKNSYYANTSGKYLVYALASQTPCYESSSSISSFNIM